MKAERAAEWFAGELARHRRTFKKGDYSGFMEALLLCCLNNLPLPKWVSDVVIKQAKHTFEHASVGAGRQGSWRAKAQAGQIDKRRADLAERHLRARHRQGQVFVSTLAVMYGYGKPAPGGGPHIVTRDDVFAYVARRLSKTPARGTARAIEDSYNRVSLMGWYGK